MNFGPLFSIDTVKCEASMLYLSQSQDKQDNESIQWNVYSMLSDHALLAVT
jgi:hypothetical protein